MTDRSPVYKFYQTPVKTTFRVFVSLYIFGLCFLSSRMGSHSGPFNIIKKNIFVLFLSDTTSVSFEK
jgi:hypothetical protein